MKSATKILLAVLVLVLAGSTATGSMTTEQFWGFNDNTSPPPNVPADYYTNTAGTPVWTDLYLCNPAMMSWSRDSMGGDTLFHGMWGGMAFNVGSNDIAAGMDFEVPVPAGDTTLTFQSIFWGDKNDPDGVVILGVTITNVTVTEDNRTISNCIYEGSTGGWFLVTAEYSWAAQGENKTASVSFDVLRGDSGAVMIESVGMPVVPEPATMALLSLGGVGVLLRRRRRE